LALTPLWQAEHVTAGTAECTILQVADEPPLSKLIVLPWQVLQSAAAVGMWPLALLSAPVVPWLVKEPLWQDPHGIPLAAV
jgi:hypothetical protein